MEKKHRAAASMIVFFVMMLFAYSAMAAELTSPAKLTIDPAKTALLLLHWQNDLVSPKGKFAGDLPKLIEAAQNIENTQAVLKASREKGVFVIYVVLSYRPGYPEFPADIGGIAGHVKEAKAFLRGSWGAEPIDQLKPLENEPVVFNSSSDAFCYTDLELIFRNRGIKNLVITGMCTNFVVESTARGALNRCYSACVLEDCCNSFNRGMHDWAIKNILPSFATISNSKAYIEALGGN
jgi:nicotinamidase-related amidase